MSQWTALSFVPPVTVYERPSARWIVPSIFSSKSTFRVWRVIRGLQPIPSSPRTRAPSSVSSVANRKSSFAVAPASTTRPPSNLSHAPTTSRPKYVAGNSANMTTPSVAVSTGETNTSPPGRLMWPSSICALAPVEREREVGARAEDRAPRTRVEPVGDSSHLLGLAIPVEEAGRVQEVLERARRHGRLLRERRRRELAHDPRDVHRRRPLADRLRRLRERVDRARA